MARYALLFLLLPVVISVHGQQFPITRLGVEEGLGHSIAYRAFQSKNGYLWFSTDNGLTRYDGQYFQNFTAQDGGLQSNFIFDVAEIDSSLLVSTFGGGVMAYKNNRFAPFTSDTSSLRYPITLSFFQQKVWATDRYKQLHYLKDGVFHQVTATEMSVFDDDYVETYSVSSGDSLMYIGTSSGLFAFDGKTYSRFTNPEFSKTNIYNVRILRNGNLLVSNKNQLLEYNIKNETSSVLFTSAYFTPATCVLEDHEGNIWISQINGETHLLRLSPTSGSREIIKVLDGIVVTQFYEDRERNMWLTTYGEGAWCIRSIHVRNYPIRGCILSDIIIDNGKKNLIVATLNAGLKFFRQSKSGFLIEVPDDPLGPFFKEKQNIVTALQVNPGTTCFSSDDMFYIWKDGKITGHKTDALVSFLYYEKKRDRIWIGCRFGLAYFENGVLKTVSEFNDRVVRSIAEDQRGNILLGTDNGIYIQTSGGFEALPVGKDNKNEYVNSLYTDSTSGVTWAGTNSGLARIERGRLEFVDYPLTKLRCNSITGDHKGKLWIGTVNGLLYHFKNQFHLITTKEGIAQSNVNKVIYQPETDLLTLLTANGISVLDAENFLEDARFEIPDIIVEQISSGSRTVPYSASLLELDNDQRDLKVLISTPIIKNRDKLSYSYRLNDEPWTEFNGRELSLKTLPYGPLKLTIRVQEQYLTAMEKSLTLSLLVPRPFFFTWWFLLLMLLILSATITAIVFSYSRRKNEKLLEENKRLDLEHKALRNLLNPHFLYNAINSIHAFILQNDQRKTLAYLSKFSQLVRLNLELLSADRVPLDKEIKNISLYLEFEKLRFADKLNYVIEIDPSITQAEIEIPPFLIQPFLENAIWHGLLPREQGGSLFIKVDRLPEKLLITVEDDGVGINTSLKSPKADLEKKTSMGINIIRDRIDLLKKFNEDYSLFIGDKAELNGNATSTGTVVKITVPVSVP